MINELRELKQYLKFYEDAKDNDKMTKKEQRELCIKYAQDKIYQIIDVEIPLENIKFDVYRHNKISCEYSAYYEKYKIDFSFYQNKCSLWDGIKEIKLTIE